MSENESKNSAEIARDIVAEWAPLHVAPLTMLQAAITKALDDAARRSTESVRGEADVSDDGKSCPAIEREVEQVCSLADDAANCFQRGDDGRGYAFRDHHRNAVRNLVKRAWADRPSPSASRAAENENTAEQSAEHGDCSAAVARGSVAPEAQGSTPASHTTSRAGAYEPPQIGESLSNARLCEIEQQLAARLPSKSDPKFNEWQRGNLVIPSMTCGEVDDLLRGYRARSELAAECERLRAMVYGFDGEEHAGLVDKYYHEAKDLRGQLATAQRERDEARAELGEVYGRAADALVWERMLGVAGNFYPHVSEGRARYAVSVLIEEYASVSETRRSLYRQRDALAKRCSELERERDEATAARDNMKAERDHAAVLTRCAQDRESKWIADHDAERARAEKAEDKYGWNEARIGALTDALRECLPHCPPNLQEVMRAQTALKNAGGESSATRNLVEALDEVGEEERRNWFTNTDIRNVWSRVRRAVGAVYASHRQPGEKALERGRGEAERG